MTTSIAAKRAALRDLHASGCFVIPNPWDLGSARYLQALGFKALATTSSSCSSALAIFRAAYGCDSRLIWSSDNFAAVMDELADRAGLHPRGPGAGRR